MIITCGQCQAKFKVAPEQIKESGSKVRCSNCQYVFTVYRPQKPAETGADVPGSFTDQALVASGESSAYRDTSPMTSAGADLARDALDKYLRSLEEQDSGRAHGSDQPEPSAEEEEDDDFQDPENSPDQYMDIEAGEPRQRASGDRLSLKERRDRRRRLYSDLENQPEEDPLDQAEDFYEDFSEEGPPPPLRRTTRPRPAAAEPVLEHENGVYEASENYDDYEQSDEYDDQDEEYDQDEDYDEAGDYGDEEYDESGDYDESEEYDDYDESEGHDQSADYDDYEPDHGPPAAGRPSRGRLSGRSGSPGLEQNPAESGGYIDDADYNPRGFAPGGYGALREPTTIRAAVERASGRSPIRLIAALLVLAVILGGFIFYITRPGPTALSDGGGPRAANSEGEVGRNDDPSGKDHITFAAQQSPSHFLRENKHAGTILVITGMVRNSYPQSRSFISLRGHILSAEGATLADRYVFAGNIISEEDLVNLPMAEILTRLSIKGGQDNRNMNIPPEHEIPFMLVFDKLPDGMAEYRIDPVGSSPAN